MASANASPQTGSVRLWDRLSIGTKRVIWAWTFLALPIIFYAGIRFYPTFQAFWLSLTNWDLLRPAQFIGLANYQKMFADPLFWKVFNNTFLYLLIGTPVSLVISFVIAFYLDRIRFMHGFIRALYFLPFLTTAAAMGWVWRWFYQPVPIGVINGFLTSIGLEQQPFLRSVDQALPAILIPAIWAGLGSRSSFSWPACAPFPAHSTRRPASTGWANGPSCARSPFRCSSPRPSSSWCSRPSASCAFSTRSTT